MWINSIPKCAKSVQEVLGLDYEYSKRLGAHLAKIRKGNHLTQEQLSAKLQVLGCDLTRSALAKIEVGQRHIYPDEMKALHQALGKPYDDLFI